MGRIGFRRRSSCRERKGPLFTRLALVYRRRHRHRRGFFGYGDHGDSRAPSFLSVVSEAPAGVEWVRIYTGLAGFLKAHGVEWLFALCRRRWPWRGSGLLAQPPIRRREQTASQFSSCVRRGRGGRAVRRRSRAAWYVPAGQAERPACAGPFPGGGGLVHGAAVSAAGRGAGRDPQAAGTDHCPAIHRRRRESFVLLTAEAGFGLVALVLHIGVYFICAAAITWRRSGRGKH